MSFTDSVDDIVSRDRTGLLATHSSWKRVRLGTVCSILNGFPFPSGQFTTNNGFPLVRIRDVLRGKTDTYFAGPFDDPWVIKPGDLLVGMDGDFNSARWSGPPALLNQRVCRISPDERFYSIRFLAHALPAYLSAINAATPSMTVKHLSSTTIAEIPLPLPPTTEQLRIADALDDYVTRFDEARMLLARVQRNLKRYRAAVLQAAVEGRLVPTEAELARAEGWEYEPADALLKRILIDRRRWEKSELVRMRAAGKKPEESRRKERYQDPKGPTTSDLPPLPEGWYWASIDQLCVVVRGASPRPAGDPRLFGGDVPWITVGDLTADEEPFLRSVAGRVTEAGRRASRFIEPGTLLLTNSGMTLGVPKITLIGGCINDGSVALLGLDDPLRLYLYFFLKTQTTRLRAINQGAAQPNLNTGIVKAIHVPLPPLAEQRRITVELLARTDSATQLLDALAKSAVRAVDLRQSILRWAFEGKLVDQDPTEEPAFLLLERIRMEAAATSRTVGGRAGERRRGRRGRMSAPEGEEAAR